MKPHTNFRTVPVTERLPEKKFEGLTSYKTPIQQFDPDDEGDVTWWKHYIEWWAEEIPEQAEPIKSAEEILMPYVPWNCDKPSYTDIIKAMHEFRNQPTPKPTDEDIERASRIYLMNIPMDGTPYTREDVDLGYQAGAKDCRDGKIYVKPKK